MTVLQAGILDCSTEDRRDLSGQLAHQHNYQDGWTRNAQQVTCKTQKMASADSDASRWCFSQMTSEHSSGHADSGDSCYDRHHSCVQLCTADHISKTSLADDVPQKHILPQLRCLHCCCIASQFVITPQAWHQHSQAQALPTTQPCQPVAPVLHSHSCPSAIPAGQPCQSSASRRQTTLLVWCLYPSTSYPCLLTSGQT